MAEQFRKIKPKVAQEAPTRPRWFAEATAPGSMGAWSGPSREVKLDTRSIIHELVRLCGPQQYINNTKYTKYRKYK